MSRDRSPGRKRSSETRTSSPIASTPNEEIQSNKDIESEASDEIYQERHTEGTPRSSSRRDTGRYGRRATVVTVIGSPEIDIRPRTSRVRSIFGSRSRPSEASWYSDTVVTAPAQPPNRDRLRRCHERHKRFIQSLCPVRFFFIGMACLALTIMYGLRASMDIALVAMVNHTAVELQGLDIEHDTKCPKLGMKRRDGHFPWDATILRVLAASYNLGFMASHIPGAFMAMKSSTKWMVFASICGSLSVASIFSVITYKTDWGLVSFFLLIQGLAGGIMVPCITAMIANWAPQDEKSIFSGIIFGGLALGNLAAMVCSYIIPIRGWEFIYRYLLLVTIPWLVMWAIWVNTSPMSSVYISEKEKEYIKVSQNHTRSFDSDLQFPFAELKNSGPFWVLVCAHFGAKAIFYMVFNEIPNYISQVLHTHYDSLKTWMIPTVVAFGVSVSSGFFVDILRKKKRYDTTLARKIGAAIGMIVPSFCLFGLSFVSCNVTTTMMIFIFAAASLGVLSVSVGVNHVDLSPNFAGALMGITGCIAGIPPLVMPIFMGSLTKSGPESNVETRWAGAFVSVSVLSAVTCILFIVWSKAEVQPWNENRRETSTREASVT